MSKRVTKNAQSKKMTNESAEKPKGTARAPNKWSDLGIRLLTSLIMVFAQFALIAAGQYVLFAELMVMQFIAFHELIALSKDSEKEKTIGFGIKCFPYLLLASVSYFISAKRVLHHFISDAILSRYHSLVFFSMLVVALILFVIDLTPENDQYAYKRFVFGLCGSVIIGVPINLFTSLAKRSLFWFFIPLACVVWNDSAAYFCGRLMGRHPLIKLSPKKTIEGFVGALIIVPVAAWFTPLLFNLVPFTYCPAVKPFDVWSTCETPKEFVKTNFDVFGYSIQCLPAQIHSLVIALFASLIAPFGGFFASGLKRALNIKDFSHLIPGHGGILDRIDCQLVMGTFVYLYVNTFIQ